MDSIFIRTLCTDRIKIRAGQMTRHFRKSILARLKEKYEGICSHHGYIRKNSIEIYKISPGEVLVHTLNGDIQYTVQYYADICNPTVGTSIRATVLNKNKFGLLAHVYDVSAGGEETVRYPILEIIVPRDSMPEDIDFDKIAKGASITISVLGKKFANRDTKISVVGSLTHSHSAPIGKSTHSTHDATDANPLEDEEEDIVDLDNEEEEEEEENDGEDADEDAKSTQQNEEEEEDEEEFDEDIEEEEEEEDMEDDEDI